MTTDNEKISTYVDNDYYKYMNLSIEVNRWIMQFLGVWPTFKKLTWKEKCVRRIKNVIFYFLMIFVFVTCGPLFFEPGTIYNKIKLTGPLSYCVWAILKYFLLTIHENNYRRCVESIETDWKNMRNLGDEKIMIEKAHTSRRIAVISVMFTLGCTLFYYVALPLTSKKIFAPDVNVTYRPLPFPATNLFFDARYSPVNEIVISIQCLCGFAAHTIAAGTCTLAAVCTLHACGQLQVLMNWLQYLVNGREDMCKDVDKRMASIIQLHMRTLNFISMMEKLLNEISFVEVVGCTLNMCLLGYYCIVEWNANETISVLTYSIILLCVIFNIFIFCYIGELLMKQCTKLGDESYAIDWYQLPGNKSKGLILIIAMSRTTAKLTAGNLMELSLNSFSDIIRTSVAYLNMLRTLTM